MVSPTNTILMTIAACDLLMIICPAPWFIHAFTFNKWVSLFFVIYIYVVGLHPPIIHLKVPKKGLFVSWICVCLYWQFSINSWDESLAFLIIILSSATWTWTGAAPRVSCLRWWGRRRRRCFITRASGWPWCWRPSGTSTSARLPGQSGGMRVTGIIRG